MKRLMMGLLATLLIHSAANAQAKGAQSEGGDAEVRGAVVDAETGAPVPSASVALWSRADSSLVTGALVERGGEFRLRGVHAGSYYLQVAAPGYNRQNTPEFAVAGAGRASVGEVRLARSVVLLEGLTVQGERHAVSIAPDRNSYSAKELAQAGGTATDVLRSVPSVQVDGDGKVSLRGNENVAVQINGRPAPIRGEQLAAYLQQLPANNVERVEVVPNPSAKHDPEGMAGIINIVMKQNTDLGTSGGLMAGYGSGGRYTGSGNLGYQSGPLTVFLNYGFNDEDRETEGANNRHYHLPGTVTFREQEVLGSFNVGGHNLNTSVDYRLGDLNVLSSSLMLNRRGMQDFTTSAYRDMDSQRALLGRYDRLNEAESNNFVLDYTLALKRTLEPQRHEISTEFRYNRGDTDNLNAFSLRALPGVEDGPLSERERREVDALTDEYTLQGDYTRSFGERTKLETGFKGKLRQLDNRFNAFAADQGDNWTVDSERSNALQFDERVNAVYGVLSHGIGKLDLQGGLRLEGAATDFLLDGTGESFQNRYISLFPSGVLSYNLSDARQVKFSYSRRIRRPDSQQLNPFPFFMDPQNAIVGNPELRPEYTDALEASFQHSGPVATLQVSPFYRHTTDVVRHIINVGDSIGGREATSVTFQNLATADSWGADVNGSVKVGKRLNGFASFNLFKMVTDGGNADASLSSDAVGWSARVNGTWKVTPELHLQAMYSYRAPMAIERGRFSAFQMSNVSLRRKLNDQVSVSLRLMDPFNTMGFRIETGDERITQVTRRKFGARALYLNFQYSIGKAPKPRQRRPEENAPQQPGLMP